MEYELTYEIWQDDMCVAISDSPAEAFHYLIIYGQDGPVQLVAVRSTRTEMTMDDLAKIVNN